MNEDALLLRRYAEERSESAFTELVQRHLDLVYSAALRRTGGDPHRAADAVQQVFTRLARDARRLASHTVLTAWLYTATRNAAIDLLRAETRRRAREQEAHVMHDLSSEPVHEVEWEKLRPVLDGVVDELGETDRAVVLLRFFDRRSFAEVGAALNVSTDAARMRTERALEKLRSLLARRGITSTAAALGAVLGNAVASAPAGLAGSITGAALGGGAVTGVESLVATFFFMNASKVAVSLAAVAALTIGVGVYQSSQARGAFDAVADSRRANAALAARLTDLEKNVIAIEQDKAQREGSQERRRAENAAASAPAAPPASVDDPNAKYRETVNRLMREDAALRQAEEQYTRNVAKERLAPLMARVGLTPEQRERALDLYFEAKGNLATFQQGFRSEFGETADASLADFARTANTRELVNDLSAKLYFTDDPFTPRQAEQLIQIIEEHRTSPVAPPPRGAMGSAPERLRGGLDWEQILAGAESLVTPAQMQGLRGLAALARIDAQMAAASAEITAKKK